MKQPLVPILIATALVMISACASAPTATPVTPTAVPPTPQPTASGPLTCDGASGPCFEVWFDEEEGCRYVGPSVVPPGTVSLILHNGADFRARLNFGWLDEDKTYDDVLEDLGPTIPSGVHKPPWAHLTLTPVTEPGSSKQCVKPVSEGTWFWVVLRTSPVSVWPGGTFTVEE